MRTRESEWRHFGIAAALTVIGFVVMLTGCASVPQTEYVVPAEDSYFTIAAENQYLEPVVIYINGARVAQLEAMESRSLVLRQSLLQNGRCVSAIAFLTMSMVRLHSTEECMPVGGHFTLSVAKEEHLWLNPR